MRSPPQRQDTPHPSAHGQRAHHQRMSNYPNYGNFPPPPGAAGMPPPPGQRLGGMPPPPGQMQGLQQGMGAMNLGPKPGGFSGAAPLYGAPPSNPQGGVVPPPGGQMSHPPFQQAPLPGHAQFQQPPPSQGQPPFQGQPFQPPLQQQQQQGGGPFGYTQAKSPPPPNRMQPNQNWGVPQPPMGQPGMQGASSMQPMGDYFEENIDTSITVPPPILSCVATRIPQSAALAHSTKVPLGAVIRPMAPGEECSVVQPGPAGIVRCKRCRTYINAFVTWMENGRTWRCNICTQRNECPAPYFCHLDEKGQRRDRDQRPELSEGIVEFIAPSEYMVRPPQPPSYFFVIDVSLASVRSGMLKSMASAISKSLDHLPGSPRTQVGFLTYDDSVHYYSFKTGLANPQMLVVADLEELFVPAPDDLLVNLQESRDVVDIFLENLPSMFDQTTSQCACLGPALKAAFTVTKHIGGKMCVFQSTLPTLGDGALTPRENYQIMGTPDEVKLLRPAQNWYKDTAIEFSRAQISVDMFLFPRAYIDVATLSELPKLTAGTLKTYPGFHYEVDGPRFESELCRTLTQHTAFEAVMRIRCTRGMRISNFYGNFFIRGTDLLALPNCNADSTFAFDLVHDEQNLNSSVVTVQSALLYTSSEGERRIRVITQALPVTNLASEVIQSVNADALAALLAKQGLDIATKTNLDNARGKLQQICVDVIRASKEGDKPRTISGYAAPPQQLGHQPQGEGDEKKPVPENLKLLPLYTLALMKNVALRGGTDIHPDERVHAMHRLMNMCVTDSKHFVYPRMFSLHDMSSSAGFSSNTEPTGEEEEEKYAGRDNIELPEVRNLTVDRLTSNGIFLLDNGLDMFLWVGRSSDPSILNSLFGTNSLEGIDMSQIRLQTSGNDLASRLTTIVSALREDAMPQNTIAKVNIVREGDHGLESRFFWHMVEDSASFNGGTFTYSDFMEFINRPPSAQGGMPPGGGRGPPLPPGQMQQGPPGHGMPPGPPPQGQMQQGPPGHGMPPGPPPQGQMQRGPPGHGMPPGPPPQGQMQQGPPGHGMPPGPPPQGQMQQGLPGHGMPPGPPPQGQMQQGPPGPPPPGQIGPPPSMQHGPPGQMRDPPMPPSSAQPVMNQDPLPPPPQPTGHPQQSQHQPPPPGQQQFNAPPALGGLPSNGGPPSGGIATPGPSQMQINWPPSHQSPQPPMNQQTTPQGPPSGQHQYGGPPSGPPPSSGGYSGPPPPMQNRPPPPPRPNIPPPPQQYRG